MEELEARLERIERRLDALEARSAPPFVRVPHPPVFAAPTPPEPEKAVDLESIIGSRWLPRAGALAIVLSVAYLVKLGVDRGLVTPAMVVAGIALVCLAIVGLGQRLRDEREAFGHVLVGIGAGGLYVDAVGAHFAQGVLSAEAMVVGCLLVSLATLGYGAFRALPAFLGIGLFGGLVAAAMPLSKGLAPIPVGLFLLVAAPAFAIAALRRWSLETMAVWLACALTGLGFLTSQGPLGLRLVPLDAALLMGVAAWVWTAEPLPPYDPRGAFPFVAAAGTGLVSLGAWNGTGGALHVTGLGLAIGILGFFRRDLEAGRRAGFAGLGLSLVVAPLGLSYDPFPLAVAVLAGLAIAEALLFRRRLAPLVAIQAALAAAIYGILLVVASSGGRFHVPPREEVGLLGPLAASALAAAWALDLKEGRVAAGVVLWGLASRLAILGLDLPGDVALTAAWIATFVLLLILGFLRRLPELRQLGLTVAGLTAAKVAFIDLAGLDSAFKAAVLLGLGLVMLAGGYVYVRAERAKGNLDG